MYVPYKAKKLAMSIDLERLRREVRGIPENWWVNHRFDGSGHDVVLLMTQYGTLRNLDGTANHSLSPPFEPTEYLAKLPYVAQVLHSFGVSPSRSRLMRVGPGARVKPHQDRHPHWNNKVRIHIPVFTDLRALFHIWSDFQLCGKPTMSPCTLPLERHGYSIAGIFMQSLMVRTPPGSI